MSSLKLSVLGSPRVALNGQSIEVRPRKALALFIYLACTGQAHERDTLATLFWPDSSQKQARSALRGRLFELRSTLGETWFTADGRSLSLSPDAPIWLDLRAFEQALTLNQSHQHPLGELCQTCLAALTEAVAHYQDDFLRGFTLPDCPEFDEWQFFQAESLRQNLATILETLINWHHGQAEFEAAIGYARQQLSLDNLHEPAHRRLMTLYAHAGQPAAALRQFDICGQLFQDELGVEPEEETVALATAIREKRLAPEPPSLPQALAQQAAPIVQERPVFVARESTLAQLEAALDLTLGGQGQLRLITGEAGAGKSALVTEFLYQARQKRPDLIISLAAADAQTGQLDTFLLFRETLLSLIDSAETNPNRPWRGAISAALLDHGPDLVASFVPEADHPDLLTVAQAGGWAGQPAAVKQAVANAGPIDQGEIIEQVVAVLTAVAAHNPLIVILEDLHWADTVSLALIHRLGRQLADSRLLILGTYRPEQAHLPGDDEDQPLEKMGRELQRNLGDIFIDLEALRASEGRNLVDDLLDTEPNQLNDSFREALYHQTGGHPLFVVELLQDLKETEDLVRDEAGRWVIGTTFDWQALPARVEGAIASRMAHLSEEQRWLLSIASVMGEHFLVEVVSQVADMNPRKLTHILSRALQSQHRLVEAQGVERLGQQRLTRYRFRHNLMQVYLYENLDEVQRVYLHEDVANTLEALYSGEKIEEVSLSLARHYQVAGITQKAVNYLHIAGEWAVRLGASQQGTQHFLQALSWISDLPDNTDRQQQALQLQLSLGRAYDTVTHTSPESFEAYDQALTLARQLDDTRNIIQTLCALTYHSRSSSRMDMAQRYSQECLRLAEESQDPELLMMANESLFSLALGLGHYSEAVSYIEAFISFYRKLQTELSLDDAYNLANKLSYAGLVLAPAGFLDRALAYGQEGLALMQQHTHYWGQAAALGLLATVYERRGEWQEVLQLGQAMIEASQTHDFHLMRTFGEMHKGIGLAMLGEPDEGAELVRQAIAERETMNMHGANTEYLAYAGLGYGLTGQAEQGLALVDEAIHKMKMNEEQEAEAVIHQIKGELLLMQDLSEAEFASAQQEAETCFRQAIEIAQEGGTKLWEVRALTSLCRLLHSQGRDEGCRQQLAELYDWFTEGFETEDLQVARAVLEELSK